MYACMYVQLKFLSGKFNRIKLNKFINSLKNQQRHRYRFL